MIGRAYPARMRTLAAFIVLSLLPSIALADVVDPEPESCPPGSTPSTAHSGPYCRPTTECSADSECSAGTCMQVMQCIETRGCGGLMEPDAAPCTLEHVVGPCSEGSCAVGECRARRVCSTGSTSDGGCGCSTVGSGSSGPAPIALLALAIVLAFSARRQTRR